ARTGPAARGATLGVIDPRPGATRGGVGPRPGAIPYRIGLRLRPPTAHHPIVGDRPAQRHPERMELSAGTAPRHRPALTQHSTGPTPPSATRHDPGLIPLPARPGTTPNSLPPPARPDLGSLPYDCADHGAGGDRV